MNRKKTILLIIMLLVTSVLILGVAFAFFTYSLTRGSSELVLGDIYMHYRENNSISLSNAMPGDDYNTTEYFEFTIDGKNTYTEKDIWYDINLVKGDLPEGKTEANRIPDKYLKFKLVEVVNNVENVLLIDRTYDDLTNQRIYVETINKNTTSEIKKTYRLYMTIDNTLIIGDGSDAAFTNDEWANAFASVKVKVTGGF